MQKYSSPQEEIRHACDASKQMFLNWGMILKQGRTRLVGGMHNWRWIDGIPTFNPDNRYMPYGMKDLYFNAANSICMDSVWNIPNEWWNENGFRGDPMLRETTSILTYPISEVYFMVMLQLINNEQRLKSAGEEYNFNKGTAYANLGVAQAAQMKLDEGFANILNAFDEDRCYYPGTKEEVAFERRTFTQFENEYVKSPLVDHVARLKDSHISDPASFVDEFLKGLKGYESRAFFDFTFAKIIRNWQIWKEKENKFTSTRLLAYMQDLCLFVEVLLKNKGYNGRTLQPLIEDAFDNIALKGCGASDLAELDSNLCSHMKEGDPTNKCMRILLTVRNFTSHNIAGGTSSNLFYKEYDAILLEIIRALAMIHKKQAASARP